MDHIIDSIKSFIDMDKETLDIFVSHLRPIRVPRKTILIKPLVKDNNVYMIERGIARSFNLINGKEMTSWFSQEGELIYSTNSFYGTTEGYENERVQVLEDSLLYYIPIPELKGLCFRHIEISNWLRLLHQKAFVEMERRLIYRLYMSAEERYKDLYQKDAGIFQRVNLSYIASYLGISPVTLWKLRKDIK
ncbi:Crp/Fnr family transcriptional regulator [Mediterranea massiliensis]|uniref:Crp/Fnr family transcriptional regulator n=2 Tax=Caecibacteroides pullorum TaxID=2725562 RepID=A0AA40ZTW3_9BACT|nr:Crp/Fnr family transcriptional regulator [Caecibacteroides pullorum]MBV8058683.1 Crp/Fnr family transcriptional regulator [Caecibacteroides pullorum]